MSGLQRLIDASAAEWNVPSRGATAIFWFPLVGAVLLILSRIDKEVYRFLVYENGVVEWSQFFLFLVAFFASIGIARRLRRRGRTGYGLLFGLFALAMFFASGEEVAWGQHILHFEPPAEIAEINKQEELTVHNIGEVLTVFNVIMLVGGGIGSIAYLVNRRLDLSRHLGGMEWLFVPPFFLASAFFVLFAYKLVRFTLVPESGFTVTRYGEWGEFCLAFALALFTLLIRRRLTAEERVEPLDTDLRSRVVSGRGGS